MNAYYNEIDPYAARWLRNLIAAGHIAAGDVDERSIVDVHPDDLRGYTHCHFFAGIGGWSYALRLAGWPDDRPVWTGSCPCQPFSAAGKQRGSEDERHLWPAFFRLIRECRPAAVFGEQVAGAAGLAWLDHVCADLEGAGYAVAAADMPACSVGAPHRRQRLWWVADAGRSYGERWSGAQGLECNDARYRDEGSGHAEPCSAAGRMADADHARLERRRNDAGAHAGQFPAGAASPWLLEHASSRGLEVALQHAGSGAAADSIGEAVLPRGGSTSDPWRDLEWLACSDGKARPTQPGLFPLAHGIPGRVGRLRAYGNAIVPQVAAEFVMAFNECRP